MTSAGTELRSIKKQDSQTPTPAKELIKLQEFFGENNIFFEECGENDILITITNHKPEETLSLIVPELLKNKFSVIVVDGNQKEKECVVSCFSSKKRNDFVGYEIYNAMETTRFSQEFPKQEICNLSIPTGKSFRLFAHKDPNKFFVSGTLWRLHGNTVKDLVTGKLKTIRY